MEEREYQKLPIKLYNIHYFSPMLLLLFSKNHIDYLRVSCPISKSDFELVINIKNGLESSFSFVSKTNCFFQKLFIKTV